MARRKDVAELVRIVNAAYAEGEAGLWVDGTPRTDEQEIDAAVQSGGMLLETVDQRVVGCVRVRAFARRHVGNRLVSADPAARGFEDAVPHAAPHLTTPCDLLLSTKPT